MDAPFKLIVILDDTSSVKSLTYNWKFSISLITMIWHWHGHYVNHVIIIKKKIQESPLL